jgi:hypothetical protein
MGKFKDLRDHVERVDRKHAQSAKALATKLDSQARRVTADLDRESKKIAMRIVKLEKRLTTLERRLRKKK